MADFLASFNFGATDDEPVRDEACASLEEVQSRLRELFQDKVTETRAEHLKASIDIGPTAHFTVFGGQGENVDPSLSRVSGREALVSQPQINPAVQIAVSQEILNAIGNVDGSTWSLTDQLRKTQGWVFTYACNHSWQQWTKHGKAAQMHAILDYSQKELDFTSRARPAFDCRGQLTIAFSKTNSAITLNYAHTPLHRTVGEVYDLFKPAPRPQKAPKPRKTPAKKSDTRRKKRPATDANGEPAPKKRRKKPAAKNQLSRAELVPMEEGDLTLVNGTSTITIHDASDHIALAALSAATAGESAPHVLEASNNEVDKPKNSTVSLNVSPEEAARRQDVATTKLKEAGINPATLSNDQFSIFSNQSPEVQAGSLKMLAKYGAERLHIVHPAKKDSPRPQSAQPEAEAVARGSVNPQMLGHEAQAEASQTDTPVEAATPTTKTPQKAKPGTKSRVFCFNCKLSKSKCSKDKPACALCLESGLTCEYPARKPKKDKSAAIVTEADDTVMSETADAEEDADGESETQPSWHTERPVYQQPSSHGPAIADMMQITPDGNATALPMGEASLHQSHDSHAHNSINWSSGLALPQGRVYHPKETNTPDRNQHESTVAAKDAKSGKERRRAGASAPKGSSRVPTPAQRRVAEPPRERHESPLERHNPMRHEPYQRSPLVTEKQPSPYGQPAQPHYASDPYRQNPNYGNNQATYPQLEENSRERIAYDPYAQKHDASSGLGSHQHPEIAVHSNAARSRARGGREAAAAADTLQRVHSRGGINEYGNLMLPVHSPDRRRESHGSGANQYPTSGAGKHAQQQNQNPPQQPRRQGQVAANVPHNVPQAWYGMEGARGNSTNSRYQSYGWGSGGGSWN